MYYLKQYNKVLSQRFPKWYCNFEFFVEPSKGDESITTILYGIVK